MTISGYLMGIGIGTISILLILGAGYWLGILKKRFAPNLKYQIKYKMFKMKYNEEDVKMLLEDIETGASEHDIHKAILVNGRKTPKQAKELMWIFRELKKIQGRL